MLSITVPESVTETGHSCAQVEKAEQEKQTAIVRAQGEVRTHIPIAPDH